MSGTVVVKAYADVSGPLFDGRAPEVLDRFRGQVQQAIADRGVELLRAFPMNRTGRAHGGFQASLHIVRKGAALSIPAPMITGVTWGPWLEGTTSRNTSTGFRGYRLFRKTATQLDREAAAVGDRELARFMPELGGV